MNDCVFCKIVNGEIPTELLYKSEKVIAFKDIAPVAPFHCLIITKEHYDSIMTMDTKVMEEILQSIQDIVKKQGLAKDGFRVVNNCGVFGQQTVGHVHFHLLGGRQFSWPPG